MAKNSETYLAVTYGIIALAVSLSIVLMFASVVLGSSAVASLFSTVFGSVVSIETVGILILGLGILVPIVAIYGGVIFEVIRNRMFK